MSVYIFSETCDIIRSFPFQTQDISVFAVLTNKIQTGVMVLDKLDTTTGNANRPVPKSSEPSESSGSRRHLTSTSKQGERDLQFDDEKLAEVVK